MRKISCVISVFAVSSALSSGVAIAQVPAPSAPSTRVGVIGLMHAIHSTNDVDKTLAFYHEVFGVAGQVRQFPSPAVPILTNSPGVTLRVAMTQLTGNGFNFELTQFGNVERHAAQPEIVDPGAPHMKVLVRDIDAIVATVKKLGAPLITRSGAPVTVPTAVGIAKAIFFRDPDGYIVEAIQAPAAADAPEGPVLGAVMGLTVRDMEESLKFWNGLLGFELAGDRQFSTDPAMLDLMGIAKGGSFRTVTGVVPGSKARIELTEFKGMPRKSFDLRVTDPNASGMAIRVGHIRELLAKHKAQGGRVLSRDGDIVEWSETVRNVFVKDPNGLNLELVGSADPNQ